MKIQPKHSYPVSTVSLVSSWSPSDTLGRGGGDGKKSIFLLASQVPTVKLEVKW